MAELVLEAVETDGATVEYEYSFSGRLRRFLSSEPFSATYDVDVSGVPESILTIPWLANLSTVAWAVGADVAVPIVDPTFRESLRAARRTLLEMYPEFMEGGEIHAERAADVAASVGGFEDSALLFSGGVDSLASYLRHRSEAPTLVSLAGADIDRENETAWQRNRELIESFADREGVETAVVGTDMHGFLDGEMIRAHFQRHLDYTWWAGVQHGLGLLGLCAPLVYAERIGDLYIAATHTAAYDEPWGSHPDIDDHVAWAGTDAHHDGYDLCRQGKLERIAEFVGAKAPALTIRSCHEAAAGGNCNDCEKCARTVVGLLLAGLDPDRHGYDVEEGTFREIRSRLASGEWSLGKDERFMWRDLQRHVDLDREYPYDDAGPFLGWLESFDVDRVVVDSRVSAHKRGLRTVARHTPYPLYRTLLPLYARLRAAAE
jgi:hypothetical protein